MNADWLEAEGPGDLIQICFNCSGSGVVPRYWYEKVNPVCAMCNGKGYKFKYDSNKESK